MSTTVTIRDRYTDDEISSFYASGRWAAQGLFDVIEARAFQYPDKVFVFDSTTSLTYGDLREQALRLALGLRRSGISKGDRVAVQLPNWTEFALVTAALARVGAILVPIMPIYRDDEVGYVLQHAGVTAAITCEEFKRFQYAEMFSRLQETNPALKSIFVVRGEASGGARTLAELIVSGDIADANAVLGDGAGPDDLFAIVYTSGTTSRPKGCLHTFNTYRASAVAIIEALEYTESDIQFGPSPIGHSTGLATSFVMPLLAGASSHLVEVWEPNDGLDRIKKYGCTVAVTATAFLQMLLANYDPARHDAGTMRTWVSAGAPVPGVVVENVSQLLPNCRVLSLYGRSENLLTTMCTAADEPKRAVVSDGSALAGSHVKIVDAEGVEVPRGTEGDIAYRGPSHMLEYYQDPVETAALFTGDGFSRSGDLGTMDANGYVRVTGRLKDIVIRGGLNISAREIEDHLLAHPAVGNVAVVGMPDELLGEKVCAYVVTAAGSEPLSLAGLCAYLQQHKVAVQKLPERLEIVDELPMTATGKIQKHILRADIAEKLK